MFHLSDIFILLVAILHFGFMVLETFLWQSNFAKKRFGMTTQVAAITANLAKNQGIYNLFLSAGLIFAQFYRGQVNCPKSNIESSSPSQYPQTDPQSHDFALYQAQS